ncbi:TPA: DUF1372 family protein [Streptococcus suis]|nr:DUF1372 family protein [Streptococcus suis]HEM5936375.1 DUF1372 family protein [Streptococcus suis]HEM5940361.1 DUF1372 family protein [Streptococcus suis]HEM5946830.1 DUF1372 family protein [Streptococcus suis]HEM5951013.1 DUF1372 family protein [Streptococcus suis]
MKDDNLSLIIAIIFGVALIAALFEIHSLKGRLKQREPVIIYQVDNAGAEMTGKVTAKDVVDGHYYVEVQPYGKFLVTKEQYEEIEIGQEIPEYLKGRKQ